MSAGARPLVLALALAFALTLATPAVVATPGAAVTDSVTGDPSAWRNELPARTDLLLRDATLWTSGPEGRIEGGDLLVRDGRIVAIGEDLTAPPGILVVDGTGKHVTPGLIDAHSHVAVSGSVNEPTEIVTAEVRIADVLDPTDIDIYRQLAGGLTTANILHGSANAIGGQNAIIKLRWGAPPEGLLLAGAPPGIKFALGENPKQSNWNVEERRYPQTRMGVAQVIVETFEAARDYERERRRRSENGDLPPRRDLRYEAILEILEGKRDVHAHSYRADEILMLLRVAEQLGFRVQCFQHVLEGYKVASEIARHGAGASTFSDWWAYKYEVIDAIPYNGAILHEHDVVVSFNSDDAELARRLNLEAAKAVRYGDLPEEEALHLVTLNPALQLGIADRVGSLEPGKDADFVVWSGHPLSTYSVCEQTWIEGRKFFDRDADLERREVVAAERDALVAKARARRDEEEKEEKDENEKAPPEGEEAEEPPAALPALAAEGRR